MASSTSENSTTAGAPTPTLKQLEGVVADLSQHEPPKWMLVAPNGSVWIGESPLVLAAQALSHPSRYIDDIPMLNPYGGLQ